MKKVLALLISAFIAAIPLSAAAGTTVDFEARTAVVTFDPDKTNVEALAKATGDAGFPSSLKR